MKIYVRQGEKLSAMDVNGKSDPYVKVSSFNTTGWTGEQKLLLSEVANDNGVGAS